MEQIKDFLTSQTHVTDTIKVPNWLFVALVVALVLIIVIIISATKNSKKKDKEQTVDTVLADTKETIESPEGEDGDEIKNVASIETEQEEQMTKIPVEQEVVAENAPIAEVEIEAKEETPIQEELIEVDKIVQPKIEIEGQKEEPVVEQEPEVENKQVATVVVEVQEDEVKEEPVENKEEKPSVVSEWSPLEAGKAGRRKRNNFIAEDEEVEPKTEKPIAVKKETIVKPKSNEAPVEEVNAEVKPATKSEEKTEVKAVEGKFEICNSDLGGIRYLLRANNGQLLYESKDYKSANSCIEAVEKFKNAVKNGNFSVKADKFLRYKFVLKSPTSNNMIFIGESFAKSAACQSNIESVKRFANNSPVVNIIQEDFVANAKAYEIPEEVKDAVKNPNGVVGKWDIVNTVEDDPKSPFVFLLYANNGQLLYESRDYATYSSCKSGLVTFIKTVQEGEIYIDPDKSGRFKFILKNNKNGSLIEYVGQNYSTKKAAMSSADSVYKFALVSPITNLK